MADKKKWDMTSINSCSAGTQYFRKNAKALVVVVIREGDWVFCADPGITPGDAVARVAARLPEMQKMENQRRLDARELAKTKQK